MPAEKNAQDGKTGPASSKAVGPLEAAQAHDRVFAETPPHHPNRETRGATALPVPARAQIKSTQRLTAYDSPSTHQRYEQESELLRLQRAPAYEESASKATEPPPVGHAEHFESVLGRDDGADSSPSLRITSSSKHK